MPSTLPIYLITLQTGSIDLSIRREVADAEVASGSEWLVRAFHSALLLPIPAPLDAYVGEAVRVQGGLLVTIYGQPQIGRRLQMLKFTVAVQSPDLHTLWNAVMRDTERIAEDIIRPPAPWCAVNLMQFPGSDMALPNRFAGFVAACAWAWVTRNPVLRSVP